LVHRWYVASFSGDRPTGVEPFDAFLARVEFGSKPLPNAQHELDTVRLSKLLSSAIDAVQRHVVTDRDQYRAAMGPKLNSELDRLSMLEGRQLSFLEDKYEGKLDTRSVHRRTQGERRVRTLFRDYEAWIKDAMTTADEPFFQVIAALVGSSK
jgi:hypothetical protein